MSVTAVSPPPNAVQLVLNSVYGLMTVPPCPHEGCGWFMPELYCQEHGNHGMTFLSYRRGALTHVKAVLDRPFPAIEALPARHGKERAEGERMRA